MAYVTPQAYANFANNTGYTQLLNPLLNNKYYNPQTQQWTVPEGGWNNQNAPRPTFLGVDALNAMAGQPGSAAQHYGFSTDANSPYYILGDRYLGKLQADWAKGIKTGGNEQIHKILTGLGDSYGSKQAFVKADPTLGNKFATYFKTGDAAAAGITPARAKQAYDYALRATGRDAVLDRNPGLLGGLLKGNLGAIAGTIAGFAIPGIGPAIGGMIGGGIQGGISDGFGGALMGGLSGYGMGSGANWLAGKAGLPFAVASSANPAPILNKMTSAGNSLSTGFKGGSIIPSLAANSADVAAKTGLLSNISGGISGALNMGTLSGLSNAASLGRAGTSLYNYLNPVTGKSQMDDLTSRVAALYGDPNQQFRPYNVTTPMSQVQFDGQNISVNPDQQVLNASNQYMDLMNKAGGAAANVDTAGLSRDFYSQLNALKGMQEADELRRLESVLFNRGGVHTGTQNQIADFQSRLDAARQARQFEAINSALAYQGDLYSQFQGLGQGAVDFNAGLFTPYAQIGTQAGAYGADASLEAKKYLAGLQESAVTRDYFDDRRQRDYMNDALSFGLDFIGGLS